MDAQVTMPDVGAEQAVLSVWFADTGDLVYCGDRLVEVLVDGATFDVSAPATGTLKTRLAMIDQRLEIGQILGVVEVTSPTEQ